MRTNDILILMMLQTSKNSGKAAWGMRISQLEVSCMRSIFFLLLSHQYQLP